LPRKTFSKLSMRSDTFSKLSMHKDIARNAKIGMKSKKQGSPALTELLLNLSHGLLVLLIQQPVPPDTHCKCLVNQVIHNVLNVAGKTVSVALMRLEACLLESSACSICKRFLARWFSPISNSAVSSSCQLSWIIDNEALKI